MILQLLFSKKMIKRFKFLIDWVHKLVGMLNKTREIWGVEMNLQVELLEEDSVQRFILLVKLMHLQHRY